MKILIIHNHYLERGGEDEVVDAEIELLREHGHEVILYEKSNKYIEKLSFIKKFIFIFFELNFSKIVYKEIKEIVKKHKPDVAHIHNIFFRITPSVYFALKQSNVPVVQSLHNYRLFCLRGTFYKDGLVCEKCSGRRLFKGVINLCWRNSRVSSFFLARLLYKKINFLKNVDSFIVTSKFSKDKFVQLGLESSKLYLKTNFLSIGSEAEDQNHNYALFLGRLVDYKGLETLMAAFDNIKEYNLKIIGDGPLRDKVVDFALSHKNVEYLGRIDREFVLTAIKNSSFLIFPSECYENMPLVIMESFSFSKPVLASNLGAIREFVIDGVNGVLFEPGNAVDLASKVEYLFSHNQERLVLGKNARVVYHEQFNRESNYHVLINIYEKTTKANKALVGLFPLTYSLADQNFNQTKSIGVFNVSTQLLINLSTRMQFSKFNLLSNSTLDGHLSLLPQIVIQHHDEAINKLGRLFWDQFGVYAAAKRNGSQWLFLPKGFTSLLRPRGFKIAVYIHDAMHDFYRNNYLGVMPRFEIVYFILCLKKTLEYSNVIFTNTDFTRNELVRMAKNFKLKLPLTITAGIGFFRPKEMVLKKRNSLLLLTSAWPHKLTDLAVSFIEHWQRETNFSGDVDLVGSLPVGLRLPNFSNWHHHRRLSESIYRQFLAEARVLLFFSRYEGFGMPPVEAMIAGTCPVFSDLPVTNEVMGKRGYSFLNGSYESFTRALNSALSESSAQINCWSDELLELYNWEKVVKKIKDGLEQAEQTSWKRSSYD